MASNWFLFLGVGFVVGAIVLGLIGFSLTRWRRRPGDAEPAQVGNNVPLEITWTAIPLVLVIGLFFATYRAEARVDAVSDAPAVVIAADGYRWGWTFAYRGGPTVGGPSDGPAVFGKAQPEPELVLPEGEVSRIELSASDVDHGFWIPDFLFKRDAIPGQTTAFDFVPDRLGTFQGRCSAFCGLQHARMLFAVRVVSPDEFARWRKDRT